jgi:hypothetical protein
MTIQAVQKKIVAATTVRNGWLFSMVVPPP